MHVYALAADVAQEIGDLGGGGHDGRAAVAAGGAVAAPGRGKDGQQAQSDRGGGRQGHCPTHTTENDYRSLARSAVPARPGRQTSAAVDPLELVALCAWCFAVALAGGLVGLVLGNIRLPLVVVAASSPAAGAGANIGISGVAALVAGLVHVRAGRINWRLFAWMAPPSMVGAVAGGYLSGLTPDDALLAAIGAVLLYFGLDLLRPRGGHARRAARTEDLDIPAAVAAGALIGLLGGFVGLILGALRMPALLRYVGEAPARAVGTNLAVGVCVGAAGVLGHAPGGVDWDLLAIGSAASIPGALLGARLTGRLSERALLRAIGAMLVVAGATMIAQATLA